METKHDVCRVQDRMTKFCEYLRKNAIKIINGGY